MDAVRKMQERAKRRAATRAAISQRNKERARAIDIENVNNAAHVPIPQLPSATESPADPPPPLDLDLASATSADEFYESPVINGAVARASEDNTETLATISQRLLAVTRRMAQLEETIAVIRSTYRRKSSLATDTNRLAIPEKLCIASTRHGRSCTAFKKVGEEMCGRHLQIHAQLRPIAMEARASKFGGLVQGMDSMSAAYGIL
jgi:hypothetical protein